MSLKGQCRNLLLAKIEQILSEAGFVKIQNQVPANQNIYVQAISHSRVGPYETEETFATTLVVVMEIEKGYIPSSFTIYYDPTDAELAAKRLATLEV